MRAETEYAFVFVVVMAGLNLLRLACHVRGREISRGALYLHYQDVPGLSVSQHL